jgi:hypothetical protein
MKHLYIILVLATCFYYTIEPIRNLIVNYQQLQVMYKVDSLIKHNKQLRESNKILKSYSDSLLVCNNELLVENNKLLQEITTNDTTWLKLTSVLLFTFIIFLIFLYYKLLTR